MQPTRAKAALFAAKAAVLRLRRAWRDFGDPRLVRPTRTARLVSERIGGLSVTPLWTETSTAEFRLTAGKIENLRVACRALDGLEVGPGEVFSFWRALGRPTAARGFTEGREIREGCVVPSIAGGLCQLSNALYDAALTAGIEVVERHAHTRVIAGSLAEKGRDATVFWNYVDLRLAAPGGLRVEAEMTAADLVVKIKAKLVMDVAPAKGAEPAASKAKITLGAASCETCGVHACFRHQDLHGEDGTGGVAQARAAFLVDGVMPEFATWIAAERATLAGQGVKAALFVPVDGERRNRENYRWPRASFDEIEEFLWAAWRRSRAVRRLAAQGGARQRALMAADARMASAFARRLKPEVTHLVVAQNLLLPLFEHGALGGRTFDVLATRPPIAFLVATLDRAAKRRPDSTTLGDFRPDAGVAEKESRAMSLARRIITPSAAVARIFPDRAVRIPWAISDSTNASKSNDDSGPVPRAVVFPGPTVGRKGAHAVRDAAKALGLKVYVVSAESTATVLEGRDFWRGIDVEFVARDAKTLDNIFPRVIACAAPAIVEGAPRVALSALAAGVPVLASEALGLGEDLAARFGPLVIRVPSDGEKNGEKGGERGEIGPADSAPHTTSALIEALRALLSHSMHTRRAL